MTDNSFAPLIKYPPSSDSLLNSGITGDVCLEVANQSYTVLEDLSNTLKLIKNLEDRLGNYNSQICNVDINVIESEEKRNAVTIQNISTLCDYVDNLIDSLHISEDVQNAILAGDLNDPQIERSLTQLERCLQFEPDPALRKIKCFEDQREHAQNIKAKFRERFYHHMREIIDSADLYTDGIYPLYLLVRISDVSNSFLNEIYQEVRANLEREFETYIEQQMRKIREAKAPKQAKCGVINVIKEFEQYAKQVESLIADNGTRREDIDRWYPELVEELLKVISTIKHPKTPTEMICLENYNYLHNVLRSIKVPCLESQRKEAFSQYKAALNAYVARNFGQPLERVNVFFEGVQERIGQGVKEDEISFQLAFSKQELRKVLQSTTLKEVRKGLEDMYKRIEKHASEPDSNLIQVIWYAMQDEFLSQYKKIHSMIERCYPTSNLSLPFTIEDILQVFSDIAQSH